MVASFTYNFGEFWSLGVGEGPAIVPFAFTTAGAIGETFQNAKPSPNVGINYYPHENAKECEAGNELHDGVSQKLNNVPGAQGKRHAQTEWSAKAQKLARRAGLLKTYGGHR